MEALLIVPDHRPAGYLGTVTEIEIKHADLLGRFAVYWPFSESGADGGTRTLTTLPSKDFKFVGFPIFPRPVRTFSS